MLNVYVKFSIIDICTILYTSFEINNSLNFECFSLDLENVVFMVTYSILRTIKTYCKSNFIENLEK